MNACNGASFTLLPSVHSLAKTEFNKRRKLFIQNVPPVTHQDVRYYLQDIVPADIVISKRLQHVIITPKCSSDVDKALLTLQGGKLAGQLVQLELYPRRMMLCICGLPVEFNQDKFLQFLSRYGEVETAFLGYTQKGDCKGYGFVEFAHNRATLEDVKRKITGSSLLGGVLYCDLVSEAVRTYEDTFSSTLYCISDDDNKLLSNERLSHIVTAALKYQMDDNKLLYIIECASIQSSEQLYYHSNTNYSIQLRYAMPALSAKQISTIIINTKRQYPTVDDKIELHYLLMELFPGNHELIQSIKSLLSQLESQLGNQQLTVNIIRNLVAVLSVNKSPASSTQQSASTQPSVFRLPVTSVPPRTVCHASYQLVNTSLHRVQSAVNNNNNQNEITRGPVTRSRAAAAATAVYPSGLHSNLYTNHLISVECDKRYWQGQGKTAGQQENYNQRGSRWNVQENRQRINNSNVVADTEMSLLEDEHALLRSCTGPITRQRRRTLEKDLTPYRKTPGTKSKKKDRPVLFEVDLNTALKEMFNCKQEMMNSTPKVIKRLLPEPEASPESPGYIGQHSQGIGGHYADSYIPAHRRAIL